MARPQRSRRICHEPEYKEFNPAGSAKDETIGLTLDEYEVIRLVDLLGVTHEQCAERMDISRTTVTEIYSSARFKLADSIVNGKNLVIQGGRYRFCEGDAGCCEDLCNKIIEEFENK